MQCLCVTHTPFPIFTPTNLSKMRAVVQRVTRASVSVADAVVGKIEVGLLVLVGIEDADHFEDVQWLSAKLVQLRVFADNQGIMNLSLKDISGELLLVSQFTLHASTKKGNRPSYIKASKPDFAIPLYEQFKKQLEQDFGKPIKTGIFGADMKISLLNDGPVTILMDTQNKE